METDLRNHVLRLSSGNLPEAKSKKMQAASSSFAIMLNPFNSQNTNETTSDMRLLTSLKGWIGHRLVAYIAPNSGIERFGSCVKWLTGRASAECKIYVSYTV